MTKPSYVNAKTTIEAILDDLSISLFENVADKDLMAEHATFLHVLIQRTLYTGCYALFLALLKNNVDPKYSASFALDFGASCLEDAKTRLESLKSEIGSEAGREELLKKFIQQENPVGNNK